MLALKKVLANNPTVFRREVRLMGNKFEIGVVGSDPVWAGEKINSAIAEIKRVDKMLSTFSDDSIANEINRNAGIKPVKTDGEIFRLIERSLKISELTHGAFDVTYYAAGQDEDNYDNAHGDTVLKSVANYKSVVLNNQLQTVFLKEKGMRIGFGANSKGYAADRAKYILQMEGVASGLVNAGGDILTWGAQPDHRPWTIATADPRQKAQPFAPIEISNLAIATSLNSGNNAPENKKGSGMLNVKKGFPVSGIKSVSIISTCAEFADAMATPVISIGINAGIYLLNQLNQVACIIIDDHDRVYTSKDINLPLA
jgi:thiamine biosynthesis lipoprotein